MSAVPWNILRVTPGSAESQARHVEVLRVDGELVVVGEAAAVHDQTAERSIAVVAGVEGNTRSLTEAAQENALRGNALLNLLVDQRVDLLHALLDAHALVVSSLVPGGEVELRVSESRCNHPGVVLRSLSARDFHNTGGGAHKTRSAERKGKVCGIRSHEEA